MFPTLFCNDTGGTSANRILHFIEKPSGVCGLDAYSGPGKIISHGSNVYRGYVDFRAREKVVMTI